MIMKLRALSLLVAGMAVIALAQDGIKLRRTFTAGSEDNYAFTFTSNNSMETPQGNMDFKVKGSNAFIVKYKDVKDGSADVEMVTKDMKMETEGGPEMGNMGDNMPKEMIVTGKLDSRNRLSSAKAGAGMNPMVQMMLSNLSSTSGGYFIEFPEADVKIGDTWDIVLPKFSDKGGVEGKMTAKLVADKGNAYQIDVSGDVPLKVDMAELMKNDPNAAGAGGLEMVMTGTMKTTYTVMVDKSNGKALSIDGKVDSTMKMEITNMGITMPGTGKVEFSAKLK